MKRSEIRGQPHRPIPHYASLHAGYLLRGLWIHGALLRRARGMPTENVVSSCSGSGTILSLNTSSLDQKYLIFVCCIDFSPLYGEIKRPIDLQIGPRDLMEQLAPRKKALKRHETSSWAP